MDGHNWLDLDNGPWIDEDEYYDWLFDDDGWEDGVIPEIVPAAEHAINVVANGNGMINHHPAQGADVHALNVVANDNEMINNHPAQGDAEHAINVVANDNGMINNQPAQGLVIEIDLADIYGGAAANDQQEMNDDVEEVPEVNDDVNEDVEVNDVVDEAAEVNEDIDEAPEVNDDANEALEVNGVVDEDPEMNGDVDEALEENGDVDEDAPRDIPIYKVYPETWTYYQLGQIEIGQYITPYWQLLSESIADFIATYFQLRPLLIFRQLPSPWPDTTARYVSVADSDLFNNVVVTLDPRSSWRDFIGALQAVILDNPRLLVPIELRLDILSSDDTMTDDSDTDNSSVSDMSTED